MLSIAAKALLFSATVIESKLVQESNTVSFPLPSNEPKVVKDSGSDILVSFELLNA